MKKLFLTIYLLTLNFTIYAQDWKMVNYRDILTFSLPANYEVKDTLGMTLYMASKTHANYQCIISKANFASSDITGLEKSYDEYLQGMASQIPGFKLAGKSYFDFGKNKIHTLRTLFEGNVGEQNVNMEIISVYLKGYMFNFSAVTLKDQKGTFDSLINTINFNSNAALKDQLSSVSNDGIDPERLGFITGIIITLLALFFGIRHTIKKNKAARPNK